MVSNVYNYYLSQYGNTKTGSKYDSHKKSDLKNIYNNIVHSNSQAPFCKIDLSFDAQKFAIDVKENALLLNNILSELSDEEDQATFKKMAYSSDTDVLEAEFIGNNDFDYDAVDIEVQNLAKPQVNTGSFIGPTGKNLAPGKYTFDVDIANVTYEFQYAVSAQDTNTDTLNKLSRLVNNSNIGLSAEIVNDALGNIALSISSNSTGKIDGSPLIFNISDEDSNFKGSVAALGLDHTTQLAEDAEFTVNGSPRTSSSNEFTLGKAYDVKLKSTTDTPVKLGLKADNESMIDNIRNIVSGYNSLIDLSKKGDTPTPSTKKLFSDFSNVAKAYRATLSANGLTLSDDGKLSVDSEVLAEKSIEGTLSDLKGFSDALHSKTSTAVLDPMTYANKVIVAYKNPNVTINNPYAASAYAGMMFNGYI